MNNPFMYVTVYSDDLPINGYEILRDVLEIRKSADGEKYQIKCAVSTGMGTDIQSYYYNVKNTKILIGLKDRRKI